MRKCALRPPPLSGYRARFFNFTLHTWILLFFWCYFISSVQVYFKIKLKSEQLNLQVYIKYLQIYSSYLKKSIINFDKKLIIQLGSNKERTQTATTRYGVSACEAPTRLGPILLKLEPLTAVTSIASLSDVWDVDEPVGGQTTCAS